MAVDSGTYTPETLARRMKIAEALMGEPKQPIRHWAEGLNELAKGYFGGKLYSGVERAERESNAAQSEALKSLLGGGSSEPTGSIPNAGASPMGSLPSMSSRVYSENEFNPIDAMVATPQELAAGVPAPKQYAALIGKAAVDNDLPPELLAAQLKQESGFNPNAVSPVGAQGISQFMPGTAKEMGVNPLDPASAIPGGARYLRQNIDKFGGSVPLGLAAYNAGPGRVQQSGGDISKLPAETRGYIANILGSQGGAGGTQVAQAGGDTRARVIQMLNSPNPAVQKMGRSLASNLVAKQFEGEKPTDDMRELGAINAERKARGESPLGLFEYQTKLREAGKPVTTIDQRAPDEFEKEYGQGMGKRALAVVASGDKAASEIHSIGLLGRLLTDIQTGKLAQPGATIGAWMQAAGMDPKSVGIDPSLPATAEAATALINKFTLGSIGGEGGMPANNFSNTDREFITKIQPSLANRPEANQILLEAKMREAQLQIERADKWAEARERKVPYERFEREWRKELSSRNVFGDLAEKAKSIGGGGGASGTTKSGVPWKVVD